jgi:hypothetical protein
MPEMHSETVVGMLHARALGPERAAIVADTEPGAAPLRELKRLTSKGEGVPPPR